MVAYVALVVLTISIVVLALTPASDDSKGYTDGLEYSLNEFNNTAAVSGANPELSSFVIPQTVKIEGKTYTVVSVVPGAFNGCNKLFSLELPDTVNAISRETFKDCKKLEYITIPYGVVVIEGRAFEGCISLKKVSIPDSVERIWNSAFEGCKSLEKVEIGKKILTLDEEVFRDCTSLVEMNIPANVYRIEQSTFKGCSSLESFTGIPGIVI